MRWLFVSALVVTLGCTTAGPPLGIEDALSSGPEEFLEKAVVGPQGDGTYIVATNQRIDAAGDQVLFPGRPFELALSPDGATIAVKNRTDVVFIDADAHTIDAILKLMDGGNSYAGIAWSPDGATVWTTDTEGFLRSASKDTTGEWRWSKAIALPGPNGDKNPAPGGFALDDAMGLAYVALSRNNAIGVVNVRTGIVEDEIPVGMAPYTAVLDGWKLYVTNWAGRRPHDADITGPSSGSRIVVDKNTGIASSGTVSVVDTRSRKVIRDIEVGLHPSGMVVSPDRKTLYVANANSDTVSVIDTYSDTVVNTLGVRPMPGLPFGSAPNALTISPDGKTLYVANGGNNAVLVMEAATGVRHGFIPTGWYPGAVLLDESRDTLVVANTKGVGSRAKEFSATGMALEIAGPLRHSTHDLMGSVSFVPVPDKALLGEYTRTVATNMRLPQMVADVEPGERRATPVPMRPGEISPIKHVLYIIKENRTYDQIFGDLPQGNGEPEFCLFGREVTPNQHALAEEFVLLDNFYCNGVLSADGHQWTNEGFVTDYLEKSFGGFNRSYPYDGDDALAYASSGFIWDYVLRAGLDFRVYGEFVQAEITPSDATWTECYQDYLNGTGRINIRATTELHTLEPYLCPTFIGFPGKVTDVYRAGEFIRELEEFERDGDLPNFMIMLLPNDHTVGTRPGYPTPRAAVADNDLAVGRIVEAVSKSKFWPETAIFVVEDDPQAGVDHVDGRRTVALCISPYTKRGEVISTHYNQNSMLRTMELILGLPPMTQLDLAAIPMVDCFTETPDLTPYTALPNRIPLDELNPEVAALQGDQRHYAEQSLKMPLDDIDQANEELFNRVIWHSVKGYDTPYPVLAMKGEVPQDAWTAERLTQSR
jgi:YVTN family beta-propeller protein